MRRLLPVLAAGLVLAACGSGKNDADAPVTSAPPPGAPTPSSSEPSDAGSAIVPAAAPEALMFSAPLIGGGDIELTTLAGRPVLLWFWAPW